MSDIFLNDLSNYTNSSLKPYFDNKLITQAATYAGLTVLVGVIISSIVSYFMFRFVVPKNIKQLVSYSVIAFVIGYILDILIERYEVFGDSLKPYYQEYGAGLLGALALVFSVVVSHFAIKYVGFKTY